MSECIRARKVISPTFESTFKFPRLSFSHVSGLEEEGVRSRFMSLSGNETCFVWRARILSAIDVRRLICGRSSNIISRNTGSVLSCAKFGLLMCPAGAMRKSVSSASSSMLLGARVGDLELGECAVRSSPSMASSSSP